MKNLQEAYIKRERDTGTFITVLTVFTLNYCKLPLDAYCCAAADEHRAQRNVVIEHLTRMLKHTLEASPLKNN